MEKKTPLYESHLTLGANMTNFGGFLMPLYYSGITQEHLAVRQKAGMFDVSHMGEILIKGPDALTFINQVSTNLITDVKQKMTYTLLVNDQGYPLDDLMVYLLDETKILLVVNAANTDKDFDWLLSLSSSYDVTLENISDTYGEIALQGPLSEKFLSPYISNLPTKSMTFEVTQLFGEFVIVSRSGYTGEDGFEIYAKPDLIIKLWDVLLHDGVTPCGLGCRDTLRFEANMPLYGHELSDSISPVEAGLTYGLAFDKPKFIGKDALLTIKTNQVRKLVGIELLERNIPRADYPVYYEEQKIGFVTTGYLSPTVQKPIALALIELSYSKIGTPIFVEIRGRKIPAIIRNRKFYQKNNHI